MEFSNIIENTVYVVEFLIIICKGMCWNSEQSFFSVFDGIMTNYKERNLFESEQLFVEGCGRVLKKNFLGMWWNSQRHYPFKRDFAVGNHYTWHNTCNSVHIHCLGGMYQQIIYLSTQGDEYNGYWIF